MYKIIWKKHSSLKLCCRVIFYINYSCLKGAVRWVAWFSKEIFNNIKTYLLSETQRRKVKKFSIWHCQVYLVFGFSFSFTRKYTSIVFSCEILHLHIKLYYCILQKKCSKLKQVDVFIITLFMLLTSQLTTKSLNT